MPSTQSGMAKTRLALVSVASLGLLISACSGGGSTSTNTTGGGGTAVRGGTLYMLGTGDVDYMDPNISYYPTGYLGLRMWSRQC